MSDSVIKKDNPVSFLKANVATEDLRWPDEPKYMHKSSIENLFAWATEVGASDITIQSNEAIVLDIYGAKVRVTNRVMTVPEVQEIAEGLYKDPSIRAKLSGSDDSDFSFQVRPNRNDIYRYRVNAVPIQTDGQRGIEITARTIPSEPPPLAVMNLEEELKEALFPKKGLILITGATGSGKTTLLASIIRDMLEQPNGNRKIITYEAPIEFVYDKVEKKSSIISQTEIPSGLPSFARGTRNALRRAPQVILIGEARDHETITEATLAATTGHAVYTTVHSNGFAETFRRMVNVFPDGEKNSKLTDIVMSTQIVISQQLVPSTDKKRIAIREYVIFNANVVDILLKAGPDNITIACKEVLEKYGKSFAQDAREKFNKGLISAIELKKIQMGEESRDKDFQVLVNQQKEKLEKRGEVLNDFHSLPETGSEAYKGSLSFGQLQQNEVEDKSKY